MELLPVLIAVTSIAMPQTLKADSVGNLPTLLASWDPERIELSGGVLRITAKEQKVSDTIFYAMISGTCLIALSEDKVAFDEVRISNRLGAQTWVFEGGNDHCAELVRKPSGEINLFIAARTHIE